jgi:hypothetical protein
VSATAPPGAPRTAIAPAGAFAVRSFRGPHTGRSRTHAVVAALVTAASLGCTPDTPKLPPSATADSPPRPSAPSATEPRTTTIAAPTALVQRMRRLGFVPLALLLPDAEGWATVRDEPRLYEAAHAASASSLVAEVVDGSFGTSLQCARSQPRAASSARTRIDEGSVRAPLALDVTFEAFADERADHSVTGALVGFAAYAGRCTRMRFETHARGGDAPAEVGARLAFFRDVSLPSLLVVRDGHGPRPVRTDLERR